MISQMLKHDPEARASKGLRTNPGDFIMEFFLVVVGLAATYSVENVVSNPSAPNAIRFLTALIMLIVWLHGQVGFGESETYLIGSKWFARVIEYYVEIAAVILLVIVTLVLTRELAFLCAVLATYAFDFLLELLYLGRMKKVDSGRFLREREIASHWALVDILAVVLLGIVLLIRLLFNGVPEWISSASALTIVLALTLWDYRRNEDFYFDLPRQ